MYTFGWDEFYQVRKYRFLTYSKLARSDNLFKGIPAQVKFPNSNRYVHVAKMTGGIRHSAILTCKIISHNSHKADGSVYVVGTGENGRLGIGETPHLQSTPIRVDKFLNYEFVTDIACGYAHTYFVTGKI